MEVFGASKIEAALKKLNIITQVVEKSQASGNEQIQLKIVSQNSDPELKKEGYRIKKTGDSYVRDELKNMFNKDEYKISKILNNESSQDNKDITVISIHDKAKAMARL